MSNFSIAIIGGGLAGCEAANQISKFGLKAILYEMRPVVSTPAHNTSNLAELVCSNSLKSDSEDNATGILKNEMRKLDSLILEAAEKTRVPAGKALAVDRQKFSEYITKKIESDKSITVIRKEVNEVPADPDHPVILATGPLTSDSLSKSISKLTDSCHLYFYDSISPIIDSESIDYSKVFKASRYEDSPSDEGDYINCPLNKEQYYEIAEDLLYGEKIETREFEKAVYFESCMPVEALCERGIDTLRFGPLKPVGLTDPATGKRPFAVLQLRTENMEKTMYNMVGFQTKLRYPEQRRIFRKIPGLENAEFLRYGSVHRNTYINSPRLLNDDLSLKSKPNIFFSGQITGVEGYVESAAMGILAGINAARKHLGLAKMIAPENTALRALVNYITSHDKKNFQPMNINFGLMPGTEENRLNKKERRRIIAERAYKSIGDYDPYI